MRAVRRRPRGGTVHETFVDIDRPDGTMRTFVVGPERGGPHPVVLFLMDAPGMREEIRDMSRRLASTGYVVASPHLYYRQVDEFNVFESGDRDRMFELMNGLSNDMATDDVVTTMDRLDAGIEGVTADTSRSGIVGYCMSGPFALHAAAHDDRLVAAGSVHGVRLAVDGPDSPHRFLDRIGAEVYVACAETDPWAPPEMVERLEAEMATHGVVGEVEWFPGTHHGFAYAERDQYDRAASERHWERLHSLFDRTLRDRTITRG